MLGSRALQGKQPKCYRRDSFFAYITARTDSHDEKMHPDAAHKQSMVPSEVQRIQLLSEVRAHRQKVPH